jgi:hypothetical protein
MPKLKCFTLSVLACGTCNFARGGSKKAGQFCIRDLVLHVQANTVRLWLAGFVPRFNVLGPLGSIPCSTDMVLKGDPG